MNNPATIPVKSAVLEINNVPSELILWAVHNWELCNKYYGLNQGKSKKSRFNNDGKPRKQLVRTSGNRTNMFLENISVWLILKAQTTTGVIHNYRRQLPDICTQCKIKPRTMESRLSYLKKQGLLKIEGKNLVLDSYKVLRKYHLDINEREQTIYYELDGQTRLSDILTTIALGKAKEKWMYMYTKKLTSNPNTLAEVRNHLIAYGSDPLQLDDIDYVRQQHMNLLIQTYKSEASGQSSFALLHEYIEANPDLNARQDTLANKLGLAAAMSFCHIKFRLIKSKLINVTKLHVRSEYRARKDEKVFHHRWAKKAQQTVWFRPDQIAINYATFFSCNMQP